MLELNERLAIRERVLDCEACELYANCTSPVPFSGPSPAPIAVLAEAPGEREDKEGQPFIGPAGQLAREHLRAVGLDPDQLAYFNSVSCFPRGTPTPEQVKACLPNRELQWDLIDPAFVLVFGKTALQALRPDLEIKRGRGRPFFYRGAIVWAVYHPAAILQNRILEVAFREDLEGFAKMVKQGRDEWWRSVPDRCVACSDFVVRFDESGIGRCERHLPRVETVAPPGPRAYDRPAESAVKSLF